MNRFIAFGIATSAADAAVKGSRGQSPNPLLDVTELMLPPHRAVGAASRPALTTGICRWILALMIGLNAVPSTLVAGESLVFDDAHGDQDFPGMSVGTNGGFAVWLDNRVLKHGRAGRGIAAASFSPGFQNIGEPFQVSDRADGKVERPLVAALTGGQYLFLWEIRNGSKPGVYGRVLGTNGNLARTETLVSAPTFRSKGVKTAEWTAYYRGVLKTRKHKFRELITNTREQSGGAAVIATADGGALVAYHAMRRSDTNSWYLMPTNRYSRGNLIQDSLLRPYRFGLDTLHDVVLQRLDARGAKVGTEIVANQTLPYNQRNPSIAALAGGNVLVTWVSESALPGGNGRPPNYRASIVGRLFDTQGQAVSDEFSIATPEEVAQANPVAQALGNGGFIVLWSQQHAPGHGWDVYGRTFGADGSASGAAFRVNSHTAGDQFGPQVSGAGDQLIVVWTSFGQDGSREGIYARRLESGALSGDEFRVNETTVNRQWHPTVAADGAGGATILWSGFGGSNGFDLYSATVPLGGTSAGN